MSTTQHWQREGKFEEEPIKKEGEKAGKDSSSKKAI